MILSLCLPQSEASRATCRLLPSADRAVGNSINSSCFSVLEWNQPVGLSPVTTGSEPAQSTGTSRWAMGPQPECSVRTRWIFNLCLSYRHTSAPTHILAAYGELSVQYLIQNKTLGQQCSGHTTAGPWWLSRADHQKFKMYLLHKLLNRLSHQAAIRSDQRSTSRFHWAFLGVVRWLCEIKTLNIIFHIVPSLPVISLLWYLIECVRVKVCLDSGLDFWTHVHTPTIIRKC